MLWITKSLLSTLGFVKKTHIRELVSGPRDLGSNSFSKGVFGLRKLPGQAQEAEETGQSVAHQPVYHHPEVDVHDVSSG
jgi:hypothetical protein